MDILGLLFSMRTIVATIETSHRVFSDIFCFPSIHINPLDTSYDVRGLVAPKLFCAFQPLHTEPHITLQYVFFSLLLRWVVVIVITKYGCTSWVVSLCAGIVCEASIS